MPNENRQNENPLCNLYYQWTAFVTFLSSSTESSSNCFRISEIWKLSLCSFIWKVNVKLLRLASCCHIESRTFFSGQLDHLIREWEQGLDWFVADFFFFEFFGNVWQTGYSFFYLLTNAKMMILKIIFLKTLTNYLTAPLLVPSTQLSALGREFTKIFLKKNGNGPWFQKKSMNFWNVVFESENLLFEKDPHFSRKCFSGKLKF